MNWAPLKRRRPQSAEAAGAEELGQIWHTSQAMLTLTHYFFWEHGGTIQTTSATVWDQTRTQEQNHGGDVIKQLDWRFQEL